MMSKLISVGKIIFIVTFTFTLLGCNNENIVTSVEKIDGLDQTMDEVNSVQQVDEVIQKTLFSYELDKPYHLYIVNDSEHPEYENVVILKKTNDKMKKIGEFGFDTQENSIEGTEIYRVSKIAVQQSKQNNKVYIYVFREGQRYEGFDILILDNGIIDKKWIYRDKQNPNIMFGHYGEYKDLFDQQRSYIYNEKKEKNQNTNHDLKEKEELIKEFTKKLENAQNRKVMYGDFLDEDYYVYVVTDQIYEQIEKILIVSLNDGTVKRRFEGGDLDEGDEHIGRIHKLFINRLNNSENPNICVFRKNEKYTKVQIFEVNKDGKGIHYIGSCKKDNETGEYIGDENYRYVMNFSFPSDYCNE